MNAAPIVDRNPQLYLNLITIYKQESSAERKTEEHKMEKRLKELLDYQKFQRNPRLDAMLSEAEGRYEDGLSDEALELVSAAGEPGVETHMQFLPPEEIIT